VNKKVVTYLSSSNDYNGSKVSTQHVKHKAAYIVLGLKINSIYSFFLTNVVLVILMQIVVTA